MAHRRFPSVPPGRWVRMIRMPSLLRASAVTVGGGVAAGAAALAYAHVVERNWFALREVTAPVLPAGAAPIRVLQVSDIHLVPGQERKIAWIRELAALEPDLVVDTGDNLSDMEAVPPLLRALEPLLERPGLFVLGSNDYFAPTQTNPLRYFSGPSRIRPGEKRRLPVRQLVDGLSSRGWVDLDNARATLTLAGQRLDFVGTDDPHIRLDRYAEVSAPASPDAALTVGVVHAPYQRVLDAMTADGAGLVIAGHTHGGQVAMPFYGALVTNCDLDRARAKGLSRWWPGAGTGGASGLRAVLGRSQATQPSRTAPPDAAYLHVSAGLGTSRYAAIRFACRPEATLLTLVAAS